MISTAYLLLNGEWRLGGGAKCRPYSSSLAVLLYFECTSRKRVPPRSYVRKMQPILSLHSQFLLKIRLCLLIELLSILSLVSKLPPRTWIITQLIDYSISFQQKLLVSLAYVHFLLYLCSIIQFGGLCLVIYQKD